MKAHEVVDYLYEKHPALRDEQLAAAIARAERAEAALAAVPWQALASIYSHTGVVLDADADAIGEFLDQHADAWAGGFAPSDLGPITQESLLPDVMPPLGRRTIEIMERKIAPSDNESEG